MALAEAEANRIRALSEAETEIEVADLRTRAAERVLNEEMTIQEKHREYNQEGYSQTHWQCFTRRYRG